MHGVGPTELDADNSYEGNNLEKGKSWGSSKKQWALELMWPDIPPCQISSPCVNPRRRYPLQNLWTNKQTVNDISPTCLSVCGDKKVYACTGCKPCEVVFKTGLFQIHADDIGELVKLRLIVHHQNFSRWHLEKVIEHVLLLGCVLYAPHLAYLRRSL